MNKTKFLDAAEVFDSWRVVPRLFLAACFTWAVHVTWFLASWYVTLPKDERGLETAGFASVVFLTVAGFLKFVFDTYSRNGRDWTGTERLTSTVVKTTTSESSPTNGVQK